MRHYAAASLASFGLSAAAEADETLHTALLGSSLVILPILLLHAEAEQYHKVVGGIWRCRYFLFFKIFLDIYFRLFLYYFIHSYIGASCFTFIQLLSTAFLDSCFFYNFRDLYITHELPCHRKIEEGITFDSNIWFDLQDDPNLPTTSSHRNGKYGCFNK